ncbi:hypothetical protein Hanom_Chr14g01266181 [Helianthus anomalus]
MGYRSIDYRSPISTAAPRRRSTPVPPFISVFSFSSSSVSLSTPACHRHTTTRRWWWLPVSSSRRRGLLCRRRRGVWVNRSWYVGITKIRRGCLAGNSAGSTCGSPVCKQEKEGREMMGVCPLFMCIRWVA